MENNELLSKDKEYSKQANINKSENNKDSQKITYSPLLNAKGTNGLISLPVNNMSINARFDYIPDVDEGSLFTKDDIKISITHFDSSNQLGKSIMFFLYTLKEYTRDVPSKSIRPEYNKFKSELDSGILDNRTTIIHFDDYLRDFNIPDTPNNRKNARRDIKSYINTLQNVYFTFSEYSYKAKKTLTYSLKVFSGEAKEESSVKRSGNIYLIYDQAFSQYLVERDFSTLIPDAMFPRIDMRKHPNALSIIFKFSVMYSMNYFKTRGIIGVDNLLNYVLNLPSIEEVRKKGKSPFQTIIDPLERDLDYLKEIGLLKKWEYCNKNCEPLTKEQLENYDFNTLVKCFINYELPDYPIELQEKRLKKLEEKKESKKRQDQSKKV